MAEQRYTRQRYVRSRPPCCASESIHPQFRYALPAFRDILAMYFWSPDARVCPVLSNVSCLCVSIDRIAGNAGRHGVAGADQSTHYAVCAGRRRLPCQPARQHRYTDPCLNDLCRAPDTHTTRISGRCSCRFLPTPSDYVKVTVVEGGLCRINIRRAGQNYTMRYHSHSHSNSHSHGLSHGRPTPTAATPASHLNTLSHNTPEQQLPRRPVAAAARCQLSTAQQPARVSPRRSAVRDLSKSASVSLRRN